MTQLSDFQRRGCLDALDKITEYRISEMFAHPVDPVRDNCPTYLDVIKHPMDLSTVRKKLMDNEYTSVSQFKSDMDLIWENTITFNGKQALIACLARQLQNIFNKSTANITGNDILDWTTQCMVIKDNISSLFTPVKPQGVQPERKIIPTRAKRGDSQPSMNDLDEPPVTVQKHRRQTKQKPTPAPAAEEAPAAPPKNKKPPPPEPEPFISDEDRMKIADDINDIRTDAQVQMLIDLIKEREPELVDKNGEVECEVARMKASTLIALEKMISSFRG